MSHPFYIVDVFAEAKYEGNQLAVVRHANDLSTEQMHDIALEMGYSETTFILNDEPENDGYNVRIFTTTVELPFAGHPTLGTAYILNNVILPEPHEQIVLNLKVGQIPVTFGDDGVLWMRQNPPEFRETIDPAVLMQVTGLSADDIDTRYPVQVVSTGIPFHLIPLCSLDAVKRAAIERSKIDLIPEPETNMRGFLFFSPETYHAENHINARMLFGEAGEAEDPATGSANGCLAAYLSKYQYLGSETVDCRVEQGYEIRRPSLLFLKAKPDGDSIQVNVGGRVQMVASGELV